MLSLVIYEMLTLLRLLRIEVGIQGYLIPRWGTEINDGGIHQVINSCQHRVSSVQPHLPQPHPVIILKEELSYSGPDEEYPWRSTSLAG